MQSVKTIVLLQSQQLTKAPGPALVGAALVLAASMRAPMALNLLP